MSMAGVFEQLRLTVLERGWLSSNNIVFSAFGGSPTTVVDTGFSSHAAQTVALCEAALCGEALVRVVNTHLHSDHCGGNAALQSRYGCEIWVPEASFEAARYWDLSCLSFELTDQHCDRFLVQRGVAAGDMLSLGGLDWEVVAAPGHDPSAVMLFEPASATMITADALWEDRLAIIFPELDGDPGFADALAALDEIEHRQPRIIIPGHGRPFTDVTAAVRRSRQRVAEYEAEPERHLRYAARALVMFRMLEQQRTTRSALLARLDATPIFGNLRERGRALGQDPERAAITLVEDLVRDGLLVDLGGDILALA
jgi:glyoxylase-like metal-dependent hydrolase (beta-lactamase superfamily II)